jgi:hypothetical protein
MKTAALLKQVNSYSKGMTLVKIERKKIIKWKIVEDRNIGKRVLVFLQLFQKKIYFMKYNELTRKKKE